MRIRITENGPYVVSGDVPLIKACIDGETSDYSVGWKEHQTLNTGERPYLLCRCGHSNNKPFCDASHYVAGFKCEETASKEPYDKQARLFEGSALSLMDQENLCAVGRFCDVGIGTWKLVFKSYNPDNAALAKITAMKCPSGRLTAVTKDGVKLEPELNKEICAVDDPNMKCHGPLWVKGGIEIEGADGELYEVRNRVTLCRCGDSGNPPFCDATHIKSDNMKLDDE